MLRQLEGTRELLLGLVMGLGHLLKYTTVTWLLAIKRMLELRNLAVMLEEESLLVHLVIWMLLDLRTVNILLLELAQGYLVHKELLLRSVAKLTPVHARCGKLVLVMMRGFGGTRRRYSLQDQTT